jgi:hypothetical protein
MARVVERYPFERDSDAALEALTDDEIQAVLLHELGEAGAGELLGEPWPRMLIEVAGTPVEIQARAVRDLLADCSVTLPELLAREADSSLHLFFANLRGMRAHLFPGLQAGYQRWVDGGPRGELRDLAARGREHWQGVAEGLLRLHQGGPDNLAAMQDYVEGQRLA